MESFSIVSGTAAPLPAANLDTDVIMPKRYLKGVDREGLAIGVLHELRFDADGRPDPAFILNQPGWTDAAFLVVGPNFGCGSSREHAVWGLRQLGIRALIGTTYAGIFYDNCARNGLLAVTLSPEEIASLLVLVSDAARNRLTIDLPAQTLTTADGEIHFNIDANLKLRLIEDLDGVGATLKDADRIRAFEAAYHAERPWLASGRRSSY
ncbi:3-isopropylmalate dehydratase small subunit [Brevundimonas goettingensis]|uniref:3-isopropylmalate dehydratase small subunit n=1 Tax=Brevundimonas goettingensis TaxID=2774190 RepID=A0A975GWL8_9CAUL|nr:3-isopropylmalate dehydratase small subunit [Brevundimonas goettingensis]QTC91944.1 3-isopropylmalate dehydratase small subunit [Brevundimonas goettingensis]